MRTLSRRQLLLRGGVAGIAGCGLVATGRARESQRFDADVIVIGAGLAGLNAALTLQSEGAKVLVLEGSERTGGRVWTLRDVPGRPEAGGSEIGADYARTRDWMRRLGGLRTERFVDYFEMRAALYVDGELMRLEDWGGARVNPFADRERSPGPGGPFSLNGLYALRPSPLKSPESWLDPAIVAEYDVPHAEFLRQRGASALAIDWIGRIATPDGAERISTLWQMRSAFTEGSGAITGLERLADGMSSLTDGMAGLLVEPVRIGTRVVRIATARDGSLLVQDARRRRHRARHVICTVPLTMLRGIAIEPALPALQAAAVREIPYSHGLSVYFHVDAPYWDIDGLPPSLRSTTSLGNVYRLRYAGGHVLWNHRSGSASAPYRELDEQQIRERATAELHAARPSTRGRVTPLAVVNWDRYPWTRGHLAYRAPGQIARFGGILGEPHGRLHFAGEHTAVLGSGMEGALESGERAALQILTGAQRDT